MERFLILKILQIFASYLSFFIGGGSLAKELDVGFSEVLPAALTASWCPLL